MESYIVKRRNFFKLLAAIPFALTLPKILKADEQKLFIPNKRQKDICELIEVDEFIEVLESENWLVHTKKMTLDEIKYYYPDKFESVKKGIDKLRLNKVPEPYKLQIQGEVKMEPIIPFYPYM